MVKPLYSPTTKQLNIKQRKQRLGAITGTTTFKGHAVILYWGRDEARTDKYKGRHIFKPLTPYWEDLSNQMFTKW